MSVCVVGSLNVDLVAQVRALPRPGETVLASSLSRHPGGKGLNQAVAAARAGATVRMAGAVGADPAGDWLLGRLAEGGVDAARVTRDDAVATGQAFITLSQDGENAIVVVAGANIKAAPTPQDAAGARVLLAQLEIAIPPLAEVFAAALPGCLKVLNAAPAVPAGAMLFPFCDLLVLNETELAAFAHLPAAPQDLDEIGRAARALLTRSDQSAVITLGADGALLVSGASQRHFAGRKAEVLDTVGAGDCFCGVLAAGLDAGLDLPAAVTRANLAASIAIGRTGVSDAMPTRAEIDAAEWA